MNVRQEIDQRLEGLKGDFSNFSQDLKKGGRQVWLAGLGAVSLFDQQGRELFGERFEELVAKGEEQQKRFEGSAREAWDKAMGRAKDLGRDVETGTSERLHRTLERLGVPTSAQIQSLIEQVEQLSSKVEKLSRA